MSESDNYNNWQLFSAIVVLFGFLFLALNTKLSNVIGWILNAMGHFACIMYMFPPPNQLYDVTFFQALSIGVALYTIYKIFFPNRKPPHE
ncbi:hypothetical protein A2997_01570 [Candidatus Nomurabacteria bacterium RIFCSPLOWO2_01_FULL_36_10b]|uniref:Cyclic nucleotide-binding domain-containing protein n=1 Tax=Candidatus Nomurabacteria bacterium RIFCSPLOWO2_01_FULL_36_10b TaxID=1801766 RepID=A0A1F6WNJ1_9BACT|nr:MAG: hypothetical protein A2997_01570 [Candidatus Nomurabacteria bacterium RIFCSPLOWO2_01_FULL_36_10b]